MNCENNTQSPVEQVCPSVPKHRQNSLKWYGWGYKDTLFKVVRLRSEKLAIQLQGSRYPTVSGLELTAIIDFLRTVLGMDFSIMPRPLPDIPFHTLPPPILNEEFMQRLSASKLDYSIDPQDRLFRAHGQTLHDVVVLRHSTFARVPDCVVWPADHNDVEDLVQFATSCNVVIIPYGGGTGVSGALECPEMERRMIISLDTSQMNKLIYLDEANLTACFQAGVIGQDLERILQAEGYTTGHEPDSYEFSSLGGWVATRASGMKKNSYGNIEDLLVDAKMVTPTGTLQRLSHQARVSVGPDLRHVMLGSEGTFGVITEVTMKIRPLPAVRKYGCLVFRNFATGVAFMREVARQRCQPASVRLMDNLQYKSGDLLRPTPGFPKSFTDYLKKAYLTKIRGIDLDEMCVVTLLFEGNEEDVKRHEEKIDKIALSFDGIQAGESNGRQGYLLTFVIAYIRDFALDYGVLGDSFEASVPWDETFEMCENVKKAIREGCREKGVTHYLMSCRVTQTYDNGACVYFYFAFNSKCVTSTDGSNSMIQAMHLYEELEGVARDVILAHGGSLSHHHGVGKIRQKWLSQVLNPIERNILRGIKQTVDPANIFGNRNLVFNSHL